MKATANGAPAPTPCEGELGFELSAVTLSIGASDS